MNHFQRRPLQLPAERQEDLSIVLALVVVRAAAVFDEGERRPTIRAVKLDVGLKVFLGLVIRHKTVPLESAC